MYLYMYISNLRRQPLYTMGRGSYICCGLPPLQCYCNLPSLDYNNMACTEYPENEMKSKHSNGVRKGVCQGTSEAIRVLKGKKGACGDKDMHT